MPNLSPRSIRSATWIVLVATFAMLVVTGKGLLGDLLPMQGSGALLTGSGALTASGSTVQTGSGQNVSDQRSPRLRSGQAAVSKLLRRAPS